MTDTSHRLLLAGPLHYGIDIHIYFFFSLTKPTQGCVECTMKSISASRRLNSIVQICRPSTIAGVVMTHWTWPQLPLRLLMISNKIRKKTNLQELDLYKEGDDTRFDCILDAFCYRAIKLLIISISIVVCLYDYRVTDRSQHISVLCASPESIDSGEGYISVTTASLLKTCTWRGWRLNSIQATKKRTQSKVNWSIPHKSDDDASER